MTKLLLLALVVGCMTSSTSGNGGSIGEPDPTLGETYTCDLRWACGDGEEADAPLHVQETREVCSEDDVGSITDPARYRDEAWLSLWMIECGERLLDRCLGFTKGWCWGECDRGNALKWCIVGDEDKP